MTKYNNKNYSPEHEDLDSPTKGIISMEEVDKLNDEYYKELFSAVPFIKNDDSIIKSDNLIKSQSQTNQNFNVIDHVKLPLLNMFQPTPTKMIVDHVAPVIVDEPSTLSKILNIFQPSKVLTDHNVNESTPLIKKTNSNKTNLNKTNSNKANTNKSKKTKSDEKLSIVKEIKKTSSDPLSIIIVVFISLFFYIYFANDFMCHLFGLFYPLYYLYTLMHYRNTNCSEKIRSVVKYFIIYGHIEFLSSLLKIVGVNFYHLKILVIICALYMTGYRQEWLNTCYDNVIFYDRVFLGMISSTINKIYTEHVRVKTVIVNESRKKID